MREPLLVVAAFALGLGALRLHAWPQSWIQGLNYLVAAFPLAQTAVHLLRFREIGDLRSRRLLAWYFALFVGIALYAWRDVAQHDAELAGREAELAPTISVFTRDGLGASAETMPGIVVSRLNERDFSLSFRHSINRRHVYRSTTRVWTDEVAADE